MGKGIRIELSQVERMDTMFSKGLSASEVEECTKHEIDRKTAQSYKRAIEYVKNGVPMPKNLTVSKNAMKQYCEKHGYELKYAKEEPKEEPKQVQFEGLEDLADGELTMTLQPWSDESVFDKMLGVLREITTVQREIYAVVKDLHEKCVMRIG